MQIVINFNDIDLYDWVDFDSEGVKCPELKEIFKGEILNKFVSQLNTNYEVHKYVRENIDKGLASKIQQYKDDVAIKAIVEQIITQRLRDTGSFCFLDRYKADVEKAVDKCLVSYEKDFQRAIGANIRKATEEIINKLYKGSAMEEFIDKNKLAGYVLKVIEDKEKENNNAE